MAKTNHVVIAYFAGKDQAATAGDEIMAWDKAEDAVKLGGVGLLTWRNGKIKTHKMRRVKAGRGAKWGMALGAAAGILSGGVTLLGGAVAGATVGAVGAKLLHQSLGLSNEDQARLEQRLGIGQAALVVMATETDVEATKAELASLGGEVEDYQVPAGTMAQVEEATEVQEVAESVAEPEAEAPRVVRMPGTLESVEGIGPGYVAALKGIGIGTKRRLLLAGATPEGRASIAEQTKISEKLIARWVSAIDLSRVTGVKAQNSELLVAADVPTVSRLAEQDAAELHGRLVDLNAKRHITRAVPGTTQLEKWIEEAKSLPQMVSI